MLIVFLTVFQGDSSEVASTRISFLYQVTVGGGFPSPSQVRVRDSPSLIGPIVSSTSTPLCVILTNFGGLIKASFTKEFLVYDVLKSPLQRYVPAILLAPPHSSGMVPSGQMCEHQMYILAPCHPHHPLYTTTLHTAAHERSQPQSHKEDSNGGLEEPRLWTGGRKRDNIF